MTTVTPILVATGLSAPAHHAVGGALPAASNSRSNAHPLQAAEPDAIDGIRQLPGANLPVTKAARKAGAHECPDDGCSVQVSRVSS